jgi:glycosyltransferase involved in cell wall biosynthesis
MSIKFAAFIMTYERVSLLKNTIDTILAQTVAPEKILVVDNSESYATQELVQSLNYPRVFYHRMGYNAGPAGASKFGLEQLTKEGYEWIYWCDDDDPPKFKDAFELMFSGVDELENPGLLGAVGHKFDWGTGEFIRTTDLELQNRNWLSVDIVAGNMCMVVNSLAVKAGVLPDAALFFGMEELDFSLKLKKMGFGIYVNTDLFTRYRSVSERPLALAGLRGLKKKSEKIWREYYSTKNLLFIAKEFNKPALILRLILKAMVKIIYNFKYGISYGGLNAKLIFLGLLDFLRNKKGYRDVRPRSLNLTNHA